MGDTEFVNGLHLHCFGYMHTLSLMSFYLLPLCIFRSGNEKVLQEICNVPTPLFATGNNLSLLMHGRIHWLSPQPEGVQSFGLLHIKHRDGQQRNVLFAHARR